MQYAKRKEKEKKRKSSTPRSQEVAQPSTDEARDCLISRFEMDLDVTSRVWPLEWLTTLKNLYLKHNKTIKKTFFQLLVQFQ